MPVFKIGIDDFKKLRERNGYFIDKSLLIQEIIGGNDVLLLPRHRWFGKTLNMTMLKYFFEKTPNDQGYLFRDLALSACTECLVHQGHPVIYPTLKQIRGDTCQEGELQLRKLVSELYKCHSDASTILCTDIARHDFEEIKHGKSSLAALKNSLRDLISILYTYHKNRSSFSSMNMTAP